MFNELRVRHKDSELKGKSSINPNLLAKIKPAIWHSVEPFTSIPCPILFKAAFKRSSTNKGLIMRNELRTL